MNAKLPIPEPDMTIASDEEFDRWYREKVQAALDDPRPSIPHEQVVKEMEARIEAAKRRAKNKLVSGGSS